MKREITKIKFLNFATKDMPERKAGQFEGVVIGISILLGVLLFLSIL